MYYLLEQFLSFITWVTKDTKCNLVTSHFWQLPQVSHNSRVTVKFIEAAHNQTAFHRKDTEMEGEGAEGGRPE